MADNQEQETKKEMREPNSTLLEQRLAKSAELTKNKPINHLLSSPIFSAGFINQCFGIVEDSIWSELCVFNSGMLSNERSQINTPKMVQILSYLRYFRKNKLNAVDDRENIAAYQSYAMAEMFGEFVPEEKRLHETAAQAEIIASVHFGVHSTRADLPKTDEWLTEALNLGTVQEMLAITVDQMTIQQAIVILEALAIATPTSDAFVNGASMIVMTITSLAKRGILVSSRTLENMINRIKSDFGVKQLFLNGLTCSKFYKAFGCWAKTVTIEKLFQHYSQTMTPENPVEFSTTIIETAQTSLSMYFTIRRSLKEFPDFEWENAATLMADDFKLYLQAAKMIGNDAFYGFNKGFAAAASRNNFRNLALLAIKLCIEAGNDETKVYYIKILRNVQFCSWIDTAVKKYVNQTTSKNTSQAQAHLAPGNQLVQNILKLFAEEGDGQ